MQCDSQTRLSTNSFAVAIVTTTYYVDACQSLYLSCANADYETSQCARSFLPASTTAYISCACQPSIYSLVSACMYDGNISCLATRAVESNIPGYSICSNFQSGAVSFLSLPRSFPSIFPSLASIKVCQVHLCTYPLMTYNADQSPIDYSPDRRHPLLFKNRPRSPKSTEPDGYHHVFIVVVGGGPDCFHLFNPGFFQCDQRTRL